MIPIFSMNRSNQNNQQLISFYMDKMNKNQLRIEDILKEEDIVNDMRRNSSSQFYSIVSNEVIRALIDYSTKMPKANDFDTGFKFPYFACELLSSDSGVILERFLSKTEIEIESPEEDGDSNESEEDDEDEEEENEENNELGVSERERNRRNLDEDFIGDELNGEGEGNDEPKEDVVNEETNVVKEEKQQFEEGEERNQAKAEEEPKESSKMQQEPDVEMNEAKEEEAKEEKKEEAKPEVKDGEEAKPEVKDGEEAKPEAKDGEEAKVDDKEKEEAKAEDKEREGNQLNEEKEVDKITEEMKELSINDVKIEDPNEGEEANLNENIKGEKEATFENGEEEIKKPKQRRKKERKFKTVYSNLDHFFEFLEIPPKDSNYVLIGYFNKILCSLLEKKGDIIISYLFDLKTEVLDSLVKHLNRRLIGECICRILTYSSNESSSVSSLNEKKLQLLEKIIHELNETDDEDSYEFICNSLINSISNKQLFQLLMSKKDLIDLLFSILFSSQKKERNLQSLLSLMIKINEILLKALTGSDSADKVDNIMEQLNNYLDNNMNSNDEKKFLLGDTEEENEENLKSTLKHLFDLLKESNLLFFDDLNKFDKPDLECTTFEGKQKVLGMYKLHQVEFLKTLIDIIVNSHAKGYHTADIDALIKMIKESLIFRHLIEIFFIFEMNNVYQNIFNDIITIVLNQHCPKELVKHIFEEEEFLSKMQSHLLKDRVFKFSSGSAINSCLFAFEINLLSDVLASGNSQVEEIIKANAEFQIFNEVYLKDVTGIFKGKLCYSEETNAFSNQSAPSDSKRIEQSLNEMVQENVGIYEVYKAGGNYKSLLEEKARKQESFRKKVEIEEKEGDDKLFDRKSHEEYVEENEYENERDNEYEREHDREKDRENELKAMVFDDNNYFDNNYWSLNEEHKEVISEDLLNDLLQ